MNEKKLSVKDKIKKQHFHLVGGKDLLAINVRDEEAANAILDYACTTQGFDPLRAIDKAHELAAMTGDKSAGDMYKIEREVAQNKNLYDFKQTGFYQATLKKHVARAAGPVIIPLHAGGEQRLVKGAFVYLPMGKNPALDDNPDCHVIENTDYKRDYEDSQGTDMLRSARFRIDSALMQHPQAQETLDAFLQTLHEINFQITHGAAQAAKLSKGGKGLFS